MKKFLCAVAVLPFMSAAALAQPLQLSEAQMDRVSAGWTLTEVDVSNTSWTRVLVWTAAPSSCSSCYLDITSQALSIQSNFGPVPTLVTTTD
jgi:hypothetical protein